MKNIELLRTYLYFLYIYTPWIQMTMHYFFSRTTRWPVINSIDEIINDTSLDQEQLENKIEAVLSNVEPIYEKNLSTVKLLAAVAPLLGLLGTVIGMIETFQAITLFGTGDPKLMADGISQALVTTMLGLITAVPLLFIHNQLDTRSREIVQIIEEQAIGRIASKNN